MTKELTADDLIDHIIEEEGGWKITDASNDRGGLTVAGMTAATFAAWASKNQSSSLFNLARQHGVNSITQSAIRAAYLELFIKPSNCLLLPETHKQMIASCVVHCGINHVSGYSIVGKWYQAAINDALVYIYKQGKINHKLLKVDGVIGKQTAPAAEFALMNERMASIPNLFVRAQQLHYINICQDDPSQVKWMEGWYNRAEKYRVW